MIYTWRNTQTGETVEVERPMHDSHVPPDEEHDWEKVYNCTNIIPWGQKGRW